MYRGKPKIGRILTPAQKAHLAQKKIERERRRPTPVRPTRIVKRVIVPPGETLDLRIQSLRERRERAERLFPEKFPISPKLRELIERQQKGGEITEHLMKEVELEQKRLEKGLPKVPVSPVVGIVPSRISERTIMAERRAEARAAELEREAERRRVPFRVVGKTPEQLTRERFEEARRVRLEKVAEIKARQEEARKTHEAVKAFYEAAGYKPVTMAEPTPGEVTMMAKPIEVLVPPKPIPPIEERPKIEIGKFTPVDPAKAIVEVEFRESRVGKAVSKISEGIREATQRFEKFTREAPLKAPLVIGAEFIEKHIIPPFAPEIVKELPTGLAREISVGKFVLGVGETAPELLEFGAEFIAKDIPIIIRETQRAANKAFTPKPIIKLLDIERQLELTAIEKARRERTAKRLAELAAVGVGFVAAEAVFPAAAVVTRKIPLIGALAKIPAISPLITGVTAFEVIREPTIALEPARLAGRVAGIVGPLKAVEFMGKRGVQATESLSKRVTERLDLLRKQAQVAKEQRLLIERFKEEEPTPIDIARILEEQLKKYQDVGLAPPKELVTKELPPELIAERRAKIIAERKAELAKEELVRKERLDTIRSAEKRISERLEAQERASKAIEEYGEQVLKEREPLERVLGEERLRQIRKSDTTIAKELKLAEERAKVQLEVRRKIEVEAEKVRLEREKRLKIEEELERKARLEALKDRPEELRKLEEQFRKEEDMRRRTEEFQRELELKRLFKQLTGREFPTPEIPTKVRKAIEKIEKERVIIKKKEPTVEEQLKKVEAETEKQIQIRETVTKEGQVLLFKEKPAEVKPKEVTQTLQEQAQRTKTIQESSETRFKAVSEAYKKRRKTLLLEPVEIFSKTAREITESRLGRALVPPIFGTIAGLVARPAEAVIEQPIQIPIIDVKPAIDIIQLPGLLAKEEVKILQYPELDLKQEQEIIQRGIQKQRQAQDVAQKQLEKQLTRVVPRVITKVMPTLEPPIEEPVPLPLPALKLVRFIKPIEPLELIKPVKPIKPLIPIPKLKLKPIKERKVQGFDTLIREKGKFKKVNERLLPENSALALLWDVLDNSASASGKIVPGKTKVPVSRRARFQTGEIIDPDKFTKSKKHPNVWVEKRKHRIDSPGEVKEITIAGLQKLKEVRGLGLALPRLSIPKLSELEEITLMETKKRKKHIKERLTFNLMKM